MPRSPTIAIMTLVLAAGLTSGAPPPDKKDAPAGNTVRGTLLATSDTTLDLRGDDEQQARRYPLVSPASRAP